MLRGKSRAGLILNSTTTKLLPQATPATAAEFDPGRFRIRWLRNYAPLLKLPSQNHPTTRSFSLARERIAGTGLPKELLDTGVSEMALEGLSSFRVEADPGDAASTKSTRAPRASKGLRCDDGREVVVASLMICLRHTESRRTRRIAPTALISISPDETKRVRLHRGMQTIENFASVRSEKALTNSLLRLWGSGIL